MRNKITTEVSLYGPVRHLEINRNVQSTWLATNLVQIKVNNIKISEKEGK